MSNLLGQVGHVFVKSLILKGKVRPNLSKNFLKIGHFSFVIILKVTKLSNSWLHIIGFLWYNPLGF